MKQKQHSLTAAFFYATLALGADALSAESLPGPNIPKQPELPQQRPPEMPRQPGLPEGKPLPGQRGTIPERVPSPHAASQQEMVISSNDIRRAQEALKGKGFDPGAISGRMQARTQEALRDYQKANDLPATGVLDQKTAEKLGIKLSGEKNSTSQQRQESTKPKAPTDLQLR
jgi:Putative peptidoglycan binding domain